MSCYNTHFYIQILYNIHQTSSSSTFPCSTKSQCFHKFHSQLVVKGSALIPWCLYGVYSPLRGHMCNCDMNGSRKTRLAENYNQYIHIYRDGSLDTQRKKSGAGYFIPSTQESFLLPVNSCSSVDTELLVAVSYTHLCCSLLNQYLE